MNLFSENSISEIANIAEAFGALFAAASLIFLSIQVRHSRKLSQGQFMLQLEQMSNLHSILVSEYAPGGKRHENSEGPIDSTEVGQLDDYLAFFEHCELLLRAKTIDEGHVMLLFSYRIQDLLKNKNIESKLADERMYWELLTAFIKRSQKYEKARKDKSQ